MGDTFDKAIEKLNCPHCNRLKKGRTQKLKCECETEEQVEDKNKSESFENIYKSEE